MKRNNRNRILNLLQENGDMSQSEIARELYGKPGCIPRVYDTLKRMKRRGEIEEVRKNPITYKLAGTSAGQKKNFAAKSIHSMFVVKKGSIWVRNSKKIANIVAASADQYYQSLQSDPHSRFRSWEHCFTQFGQARGCASPDFDLLSLHLAFYLASWGMLRGRAFLLQKDYRVHIPAVKILLEKQYDPLFAIDSKDLLVCRNRELLFDLVERLETYYEGVQPSAKKSKASDTLISKILLGTLGCVPAYDRFFKAGIRKAKIASGKFNRSSVRDLAQFYQDNLNCLQMVRSKMTVGHMYYPQMKILDMGFWQAIEDKKL